ncbi:MAG: hypothetical protein A2Y45_08465 [Tenericutes bacterium GWC2_34_14]|nr:MAG: hypothetical protein A2Z84_04910 [Tenericutes bacterium GWA2_35_7]OHE29928.1 MAG: hypothetical protein A2Y45_08465 [Tenericutes bacterium GWC2_34_14]OHE34907.1 MAG: hypothetical protein A2012_02075 [Tenericutes bacterium GWE2_34_108]OHE37233.1 MAG: hypothetical protein A2Y46_00935 [Tenericutes bacterium GWF1_35_14]OHE39635.1 MAG: hypothetical protein A2Y44_01925 [Tenericutes bacterium GWF2_35_184]OHE44177.1 MAG: hypothetical protein A2221_03585 [Tenericutes bacterium RIFOXYA2_FULL_36_3
MRKFLFLVAIALLLVLGGCKEKDKEYAYTYAITQDNYETFLSISHAHWSEGDKKKMTTIIDLKDEDALLEGVSFDMKVHLSNMLWGYKSYVYQDYTLKLDGNMPFTHEMSYSFIDYYEKVVFSNFKGTIKTNTKQDFPSIPTPEESAANYTKLMEDLNALESYTSLTMNTVISVKHALGTEYTRINTVIDSEDYYIEMMVDNETGFIVKMVDDQFLMYEVFRYDNVKYYRLAGVFEEEQEDWEEPENLFGFDESWIYAYEDEVYTVTASIESLLRLSLDDEDILNELLANLPDEDVTMTLDLSGDMMTLDFKFKIEDITLGINTTYQEGVTKKLNLNLYTKLPANSPWLVDDYTDLTERQIKHLHFDDYNNYYVVNLEDGTYAIELTEDFFLDLKLYDTALNEVNLTPNPGYASQDYYQGIYDIPAGEYFVEVSSEFFVTTDYDLQFHYLSSLYETLPDPENPVEITEGTFDLEIEGKYDIVYATFNAPEGGMLVLAPNQVYSKEFLIFDPQGNEMSSQVFYKNDFMYLSLRPGVTTFLFRNQLGAESVTFTVSHYGSAPYRYEPLPVSYPSDYVVINSYYNLYYTFDLSYTQNVTFQSILDTRIHQSTSGINYQIWRLGTSHYEIYREFRMLDSYSVELPAGSYYLRAYTVASVKIRASYEMPHDTSNVDAWTSYGIYSADFAAKPRAYMSKYIHYPNQDLNIHFETGKLENVMIAFDSNVDYILYDSLGNVYNSYPQLGFRTFELPKGSYYIHIEDQGQTSQIGYGLAVVYLYD